MSQQESDLRPSGIGDTHPVVRPIHHDLNRGGGPADPVHSFMAAMSEYGVQPSDPRRVVPDGQIHRFHVVGDRAGTANGWCVLRLDGLPGGAFGSWRTGVTQTWCAYDRRRLAPADRAALDQQLAAARAERDREIHRQHSTAAGRAARIWSDSRPADSGHPYLRDKRVPPLEARQYGDQLVLRIVDLASRELTSLQFISADGGKKLLAGGKKRGCVIHVAGRMPGARRVLISEGWATGASLAALEPDALVLAAIDAGNLEPVAKAARREWPAVDLVICADADPVGIQKARAAAIAAGALISIPPFPKDASGSDWNDYVNAGFGGIDHG